MEKRIGGAKPLLADFAPPASSLQRLAAGENQRLILLIVFLVLLAVLLVVLLIALLLVGSRRILVLVLLHYKSPLFWEFEHSLRSCGEKYTPRY